MMDYSHIPSYIAALGSIAAMITSLINRAKIQEVHLSVNSRLTELLKATKAASHAEGLAEGRESKEK
jgi:hypothetical protein